LTGECNPFSKIQPGKLEFQELPPVNITGGNLLFYDIAQGADGDPVPIKGSAELLHEGQRLLAVTVDTHGIRGDGNFLAGDVHWRHFLKF
jgi:hypothetical protein